MTVLKKYKGLIAFAIVAAFLFAALFVGKGFFLRQVRTRIEKSFRYGALRLSYLPPALILENVRSISDSPYSFSAKKVSVEISFVSLLKKEKPLTMIVDSPVLRISKPSDTGRGKPGAAQGLPLALEKVIVREGDARIWRKEGVLHVRKLKALFVQKRDSFTIQAESEDGAFTPASGPFHLAGKLSFSITGKGRDVIVIHRAIVDGPGFLVKASGKISDLSHPLAELKTVFNVEMAPVAHFLGIPFAWEGRVEGRGRIEAAKDKLSVQADMSSRTLIVDHVPLGDVQGRVNMKGKGVGEVTLSLQKKHLSSEALIIRLNKGRIEGEVLGARLDPIMSYVRVPWPVRSPAWGKFVLQNKKLEVEAEFRDSPESTGPAGFPFRGNVLLNMDLRTKELSFSSPALESSFGKLEIRGGLRIKGDVDVGIKGEFEDLPSVLNFAETVLSERFGLPEVKGRGKADILVHGEFRGPQISIDLDCSPGSFDRIAIDSVKGTLDVHKGTVLGKLELNDPRMKGGLDFKSKGGLIQGRLRMDDGVVEDILPLLGVSLPVSGRTTGAFEFTKDGARIAVKGDFNSPALNLLGQTFGDAKGGLDWQDGTLKLDRLNARLFNGSLTGRLSFVPAGGDFDMDLEAQGLDLQAVSRDLHGILSLDLKGKGVFGKDRPQGKYSIRDGAFSSFRNILTEGTWTFGYLKDQIDIDVKGNFLPGENEYELSMGLPLNKDAIAVDIKGDFNNLDLLFPWPGAKGSISYRVGLGGRRTAPAINGVIGIQSSLLPFPGFAYALKDINALAFIRDGRLSVKSVQAKLGDGVITGNGEIGIGPAGLTSIDFRVDGKNMPLSPIERTQALADGWLRILKDGRNSVLEGDFIISKLSWRREFSEGLSFGPTSSGSEKRGKSFFDDMTLKLRLRAKDNAWVINSWGRIQTKIDLALSGTLSAPVIDGAIDAISGEIAYQDRRFKIVRGQLSFFNTAALEPFLDFMGETYIKDYRVVLTLNGLITPGLKGTPPKFTTSPSLPDDEIMALLTMGESYQRNYSYSQDTTLRLSTASLVAGQLADKAQRKGEGLFSLARFRIDPFLMGSSTEMGARLTVGRQVSKNFSFLYSTNLTTQREEIVRLEWEFKNNFSLVAIRNELGRISLDLKFRKRF